MNLSEVTYPKDTKNRVHDLLVQEARRKPKPARRWLTFPVVIAVAGTALVGSTAAGIYTALAPVNDKRDIRCYYHADLTTRPPVVGVPGETKPPYITAGVFITGFDAADNPNPDDKNAGMQQVPDPINLCSRVWDMGEMNRGGVTNDLIPAGFVPVPPVGAPDGRGTNQYGIPLMPGPNPHLGQYVPPLTACVVDNTVAVIPGGPEICARLGVPTLEK